MNIIETAICSCIGGLAVVLPYIIYMRIRTRRNPATAIGKPAGAERARSCLITKRIFHRMILKLTYMPN